MTATLDDVTKQLKLLNETCSRIADLLEISMGSELHKALAEIFVSPRDRRIYELSDGIRSTREIGKIVGLDQKGISRLWNKWAEVDIVESTGHLKPYRAKFTLVELTEKIKSMDKK